MTYKQQINKLEEEEKEYRDKYSNKEKQINWERNDTARKAFRFAASTVSLGERIMANNYDFHAIEKKWQDKWEETGVFHAKQDFTLPKYYCLVEFPYPSGQGLHVGHPRSYTALDIIARKKRLEGYNVLYPMGWDAFGLPTENYAIKNHIHPEIVTRDNVAHFKQQLQSLGFSFDWSREVNTTDPSYYKWTQWIFLQLFKKGLAYKKEREGLIGYPDEKMGNEKLILIKHYNDKEITSDPATYNGKSFGVLNSALISSSPLSSNT